MADSQEFLSNFIDHVKAGFGGVAVQTVEVFDLVSILANHQHDHDTVVLHFAPGMPLRVVGTNTAVINGTVGMLSHVVDRQGEWLVDVAQTLIASQIHSPDEPTPFESLLLKHRAALAATGQAEDHKAWLKRVRFVVVLQNVASPETLKNLQVIQYLQMAAFVGRIHGVTYVLQTYDGHVGQALEPYFPVLKFPTPKSKEAYGLISNLVRTIEDDVTEDGFSDVVSSCRGMTRRQIEDTTALLMRTRRHRDSEAYKQAKIIAAEQDGLFKVIDKDQSTDELFGLDGMTRYTEPLLRYADTDNPDKRARGFLFAGPSGTGKSAAAIHLARVSDRTLCEVDLGSLRSKWVGDTEARVDRMFELVESLSPSILLVNEIEKALDGTQSSGETDGGLGSRVLAKFLAWAQDHTEDVLLVATANDVTRIMDNFPEALRAERFDGMFMVDLPGEDARKSIWQYYLGKFGLKARSQVSSLVRESENWTGAEIRACCRLSSLRGVDPIAQMRLVPKVYKNARDVVEGVQKYADGKFIDADTGDVYSRKKLKVEGGKQRRVDRN